MFILGLTRAAKIHDTDGNSCQHRRCGATVHYFNRLSKAGSALSGDVVRVNCQMTTISWTDLVRLWLNTHIKNDTCLSLFIVSHLLIGFEYLCASARNGYHRLC
jgi:hypothetical protein